MRKLTLEQRVARLERLIKNEKKVYIPDINMTKDLLVALLDDKKANTDNLTIKDLSPEVVSDDKYGKLLKIKATNGFSLTANKWRKATDDWFRRKAKNHEEWLVKPSEDFSEFYTIVYRTKESNESARRFSRKNKFENAQLSAFDCARLSDIIENKVYKNTNKECYVDIVDDNAVYGFINVGVDCDGTELDYDIEAEARNSFIITSNGTDIGKASSLTETANIIADDVEKNM